MMKKIEVTWEDITQFEGWTKKGEAKVPELVHSVGYLVKQDKKYLYICTDYLEDAWGGLQVFSHGCVKKVRRIL